jgi:beta-lactamase regulating signal transducer with metallopeptidase domain
MDNEVFELLLRLNVAFAAGVLLVLALRLPVRRMFGARVAYGLWLIPLAAALMCFVPGRIETVVLDWSDTPMPAVADPDASDMVWALAWAFGALVSLSILAIRQARFTQSLGRLGARDDLGKRVCTAQSSDHGPAVIGVLRPMIVTPADFETRFNEEERRLVLAHERAHVAHGDPWINAIVLALQCLNWFNPFVHIGARLLRIDQELACDAAVLEHSEGARRRYAEAMLKTHLSSAAPIGCAWPASDVSTFKERIAMLKRTLPSRATMLLGTAAIAIATGTVAAVAWAAQPPRVVATYASPATLPDMPDLVHPINAEDELAGALDDLDALEDLNIDLHGDSTIVINGEVMRARDMTPEQREEVRQSLEEARADIAEAREEVAAAREEARAAEREHERLGAEDRAEIREAQEEARRAQIEARAIQREAMIEARAAVREARLEQANYGLSAREMAEVREALREAEAEITRAIAEAQAEGDAIRAEALENAAAAIELHLDRDTDVEVNADGDK